MRRFLAMVALAFCAAPAAHAACKIALTPLSVTMAGTRPLISGKINGRQVRFVADSGAFYSLLSPALTAELKLSLRPAPFRLRLQGVGGLVTPSLTTIKRLTIDGINVPNVEFLVGGGEAGDDAAGVLGQNIWHIGDVEYDLANGVIRLARPSGCSGQSLAYWARNTPVGAVDMMDSPSGPGLMTQGEAQVNGKRVKVLFDTGASYSFLTFAAARRLGIDPEGPQTRPLGVDAGIGRRTATARLAKIDSFEIGGEKIEHTHLQLVDTYLQDADMALGADFFLSHRVYVANRQRKIYFTYDGGPVFALGAPVAAPVASVPSVASTGDASDVGRKGAAELGRLEYAAAIAYLSRAHELAPQEPLYLYQRAQAYLGNKQPAVALADLDAAITLAPGDVGAHVLRAQMRLAAHDQPGAILDLDAASAVLPPQADARLALSGLYVRADAMGPAMAQADIWIKAHPDDAKLPMALNERCWAGALSGDDLDGALRACDAAIHRQPKNPMFLDSRGLVRLRMGDIQKAMADYDAALAHNPKTAWSLYGRGLAEAKLGQRARSKTDIAAAATLDPKLAARALKLGIGP